MCPLVTTGGSAVKNLPATQDMQEAWVQSLGWEDPLEKEMVTSASVLAWRIPWTERESDIGIGRKQFKVIFTGSIGVLVIHSMTSFVLGMWFYTLDSVFSA